MAVVVKIEEWLWHKISEYKKATLTVVKNVECFYELIHLEGGWLEVCWIGIAGVGKGNGLIIDYIQIHIYYGQSNSGNILWTELLPTIFTDKWVLR